MKLRLSNLEFGAAACVGVCAVGPQDRAHPNKMPFKGTLLLLDEPSNKPPHGAEGHRIFVPAAVAKKRLSTLISMGVNYTPDLDSHSPRHKVGVITGAHIDGNKVVVNGYMWKKDFPEVERDMKAGKLGMSMELSDVYVRSKEDPVWYLEDFHFSGATILFKSAAAYTQTSLAASARKKKTCECSRTVAELANETALAAAAVLVRNRGGRMANQEKKKEKTADSSGQGELLAQSIAAAIGESLKPFVSVIEKQTATIGRLAASMEEVKTLTIEASKHEDDEDDMSANHEEEEDDMSAEHEDDDDMAAKGKKKGEEDDEDEDEDDDAELDAEMEHLEDDPAEDEPGEINKEAKEMGNKTKRTGKIGKAKNMKELVKASGSIRASSVIRELYASHRALRTKYRTLRAKAEEATENLQNKIDALEAQVEQYAERVDRKSVSAELTNFLAKSNVDVRELRAEGRKMSIGEIDQIFANAPVALDPTTRMWFKNQLLEANLLEQGEIHRGN